MSVKTWIDEHPFLLVSVSCIAITLFCSLFLFQRLENQITAINQEREDRVIAAARITGENCKQNNKQDAVLAGLLQVSLANSPPRSAITEQQREGYRIFHQALKDLEKPSQCKLLVRKLLEVQGLSRHEIKNIIEQINIKSNQSANIEVLKPANQQDENSSNGSPSDTRAPPSNASPPVGSSEGSPEGLDEGSGGQSNPPATNPPDSSDGNDPGNNGQGNSGTNEPPDNPPPPNQNNILDDVNDIIDNVCDHTNTPLICQQ